MSVPTAVVVDYGIGNVFSVCQAIRQAGGEPFLSGDPAAIIGADRLILPGVGAFGKATAELRRLGLEGPITEFCAMGRPFLGICVGMQVMLETGHELGDHPGLGLIAGDVERIPDTTVNGGRLRVPNIGWTEMEEPGSRLAERWKESILSELTPRTSALYFLHSYAVRPTKASDVLAEIEYGGHRLVAAVRRDNLSGVQFHPERSGETGQRVLRRFLAS